jgi:hypothetical protein
VQTLATVGPHVGHALGELVLPMSDAPIPDVLGRFAVEPVAGHDWITARISA